MDMNLGSTLNRTLDPGCWAAAKVDGRPLRRAGQDSSYLTLIERLESEVVRWSGFGNSWVAFKLVKLNGS